ncbi:glutamate--tRNA ligase [Candidatus Saccharibacteria bacterium]|nr:glutamate--tRNA ligase [Candidatus Saccharibacteria bacterium]
MEKAVTRFAPSPTGYIHIGNVRSAIYPYLLAKQTGGTFILRIEDTDRARFVEGATDLIKETLLWLGLNWDEGPDIGGPHAPYFQTERKELYISWAKKLMEKGLAYADETSSEKIDEYRKEDTAKKIPYLYRNHRPENTPEWHEGIPIRFKTTPKNYEWHDEVMGDMKSGPEVLDDIILIKKDGLPTYNFAHIIDDMEMGVTHVIRGQEYLSSMPNYLALYEALEIPRPKFVSLPHILAPQGNKKLSKRDGAKSVTDYLSDGILPEAMLNYLACLGWNDGTEQEIYTKGELLEKFSLDRIQNSGARFDETKLLWTNGMWIRKIHDEEGNDILFSKINANFWPESAKNYPEEYQKKVLDIIYDRLKTLDDLKIYTNYFFEDPIPDISLITGNKFLKKMSEKEISELLNVVSTRLNSEEDWSADHLQDVLNELLEETGKKPAELFSLIRIAVSFAPFSPALHLTLETLGKDRVLSRLNFASRSID